MNRPPELSPATHNEARMKQLDASMEHDELTILQTNRHEVSEFLRLGRKWGFFALAPKTSESAGREVLMNNFMPESNLAALIGGRDQMSLASIEGTIDVGLAEDPKYAASFFISRINGLQNRESEQYGTVALDAGDALKMLVKEADPTQFLRWVNVPAPEHAVPDWFHVIEKYGMGPEDLDMIFAWLDSKSSKDSLQRIEGIRKGMAFPTNGSVA